MGHSVQPHEKPANRFKPNKQVRIFDAQSNTVTGRTPRTILNQKWYNTFQAISSYVCNKVADSTAELVVHLSSNSGGYRTGGTEGQRESSILK